MHSSIDAYEKRTLLMAAVRNIYDAVELSPNDCFDIVQEYLLDALRRQVYEAQRQRDVDAWLKALAPASTAAD